LPSSDIRVRFSDILGIHARLNGLEEAAGVPPTREPSAGFAIAAHRWASGAGLAESVSGDGFDEITGGDFVRNVKQLVDLLRQLGQVADAVVASRCNSAADALVRDIVAAGGSVASAKDGTPASGEPEAGRGQVAGNAVRESGDASEG
jgi:ATP-dependent RNA helicase HelY